MSFVLDCPVAVAREHRLTTYDACHREPASRGRPPLASRDRDLCRAAGRMGVELLAA